MACNLANLEDHELGWVQRCEPNEDIDYAQTEVILRCRLGIALDEVGLARKRGLALISILISEGSGLTGPVA